jgi:hypothetical protein
MGKNYRRIEQLKAIASDCGFGNEDAKQFGKLSKTATWEAMLETYGVPFPVDNSSLDTEDTEDIEKATDENVGRGGQPSCGLPPPRPRLLEFRGAAGTKHRCFENRI